MKKITALLIATAFTFSLFAQEIETYSIDDLDTPGDFDSYTFLSNQEDLENDISIEKTSVVTPETRDFFMVEYTTTGWEKEFPEESEMIKEAISYELDIRNMDKDPENPEMVIQYHIFDSDNLEDDRYITGSEDYRFQYTKKKEIISKLNDGTIVVSIIDPTENASVWEGFAYNAYDETDSYRDRQQNIRQAINALMEQFEADIS